MRVMTTPVQAVVRNPESVSETVDPMEELNHGLDELCGRFKLLLDETGVLTRKGKEAELKQKQKERDFILAPSNGSRWRFDRIRQDKYTTEGTEA